MRGEREQPAYIPHPRLWDPRKPDGPTYPAWVDAVAVEWRQQKGRRTATRPELPSERKDRR